eukprot:5878690-Amphidinium_carterae.1
MGQATESVDRQPILPDPVVNAYLLTAFLQRHNEQLVGMITVHGMKTLAVCMDIFLLAGRVLPVLDVMTQRFKAFQGIGTLCDLVLESCQTHGTTSLPR